jgi:hypothetical protein
MYALIVPPENVLYRKEQANETKQNKKTIDEYMATGPSIGIIVTTRKLFTRLIN